MQIDAVLFDLDGTLADTAPDLGGALNRLREDLGMAPLSLDKLRPHASAGARGLIGAGFGIGPEHSRYPELQKRFLALYESQICADTHLFDGISELLDALEQQSLCWGIVTNKIERFTRPLLEGLGLYQRSACVISGDSAVKPKPDPAPLLMASDQIAVVPTRCVYVGDDERDVSAGRAAGMHTIIAAWGYLGGKPIAEWGADTIVERPADILGFLNDPH